MHLMKREQFRWGLREFFLNLKRRGDSKSVYLLVSLGLLCGQRMNTDPSFRLESQRCRSVGEHLTWIIGIYLKNSKSGGKPGDVWLFPQFLLCFL